MESRVILVIQRHDNGRVSLNTTRPAQRYVDVDRSVIALAPMSLL